MTRSIPDDLVRCALLAGVAACSRTSGEETGTTSPVGPMDCYDERGTWEEVHLDRSFVSDDRRWAMEIRDPWKYDGWLDLEDFISTRFFSNCQDDACADMIRVVDHTPSGESWSRLANVLEAAGFDEDGTTYDTTDQGVCYGERTSGAGGYVLVERELLDGRGVRFRLELYQMRDEPDPRWLEVLDTFQVAFR